MSKLSSKNRESGAGSVLRRTSLERKEMTFEAMYGLLEKLGTTLELDKIVRLFLMTLMGQLGLRKVAVYLAYRGGDSIECYHSIGGGLGKALPSIPTDGAFCRWVGETGADVELDAFFNEPHGSRGREEALVSDLVGRGYSYAYPMLDRGDCLGLVLMGGKIGGAGFSVFDRELLEMFTRVATITIKNALLYRVMADSKIELERFARLKKEFINHTSHELRTPLTVLKSTVWSLETDQMEENILLSMAKDAIQHLQEKVDSLLTLNEIELGGSEFKLDVTDVTSIIEGCLQEMIPEVEEKLVAVDLRDEVRHVPVTIDPPKFKLALAGILENAVNFVARGGRITITTSVVDSPPCEEDGTEIREWHSFPESDTLVRRLLGSDAHEDHARAVRPSARDRSTLAYYVIRIKDDGIGIPQGEIASLAEPFRRASNSPNSNVKGLGIGLSLTQRIIAGHGGHLYCASAPGRGAEFSIWLPHNR